MSLQKKDRWFILTPLTVTQRVSFSDIEKHETEVDRGMLKDI
jgi:hypothetical protein